MNGFRQRLSRFMYGRRGMDELGIAIYVLGLVVWVIGLFVGGYLSLLYLALWIYGLYRSFSRNLPRRQKENDWFLGWYRPIARKFAQAKNRFKNRKIYLYYHCPNCKCWLKLPRHIGEKTVTCGQCGATFQKKA